MVFFILGKYDCKGPADHFKPYTLNCQAMKFVDANWKGPSDQLWRSEDGTLRIVLVVELYYNYKKEPPKIVLVII